MGRKFGRARPATGFSLDLRDLIRILPQNPAALAIRVAAPHAAASREAVAALRQAGEVVIVDYLNESPAALQCDRELIWQADAWCVVPCSPN